MFFVLITGIAWIMQLKAAGTIEPALNVGINKNRCCGQAFCYRLLAPSRITRFHRRFMKKLEIFHYS